MAPQRTCNTCGKHFSSRCTLWAHKNTVHKNVLRHKPYETIPPEKNSSSSAGANSSVLRTGSGKKRRRVEKSLEEIESDVGRCEEDEGSEIENCDELEHGINNGRIKPYQLVDTESAVQQDSSFDEAEDSPVPLHGCGAKRQRTERSSRKQESEGEEYRSMTSEDENSEIENHYELKRGVDESEMETSESEEEDEEITMDEEQKQETSIEWPVSRTYRIRYPWSFWGEIPSITKNIRWLERLRVVERPTVIYNIKNASNSQLFALCEIAYNCVKGHIPLEPWNWKELRKCRRAVRFLANPDVDMEDKREEILRRGADFIVTLLYTINPLILFNVPRTLKVDIPQEDGSEEEDVDEY